MTSFVWIVVLASLVATHAQELDLFDALGDDDTPTEKPKVPVVPEPEAPKNPGGLEGFDLSDALGPDPEPDKPAVVPPKEEGTGGDTGGFDLNDAFGEADNTPADPKKPDPGTGGGDGGFDLGDALGGPDPEPEKPAVVPPKDGGTGGGDFGLDDLSDVAGGNDYKPEGGKGGGRAADSGYNDNPSDHPHDQPAEASQGPMAGILSAVGVAILGAASSYFAYQKKKLCFKIQGGQDPESGKTHQGTESEPQVLSNLLRTS